MELRSRKETNQTGSSGETPSSPSSIPPVTWLRRSGEVQLGTAWVLAVLTGGLVIIFSAHEHAKFMFIPVLMIMASYALYGHMVKQKNIAKFADSLYFMGFLWTLVALIRMFNTSQNAKMTATVVLGAFGYALVTTCAGMFLRLLFLQFQETVPDMLLGAEEQIDQHVTAFTEEMAKATSEVLAYRKQANTVLNERLEDFSKLLSQIHDTMETSSRQLTEGTYRSVDEALRLFATRLNEIEIPRERVKEEVIKLTQQLGKWGEKLEKLMPTLEERLTASVEDLTLFTTNLKKLYESNGAKDVESAFKRLSETLNESGKRIQTTAIGWEKTTDQLEQVARAMTTLEKSIAQVSQQLGQLDSQVARFGDDILKRSSGEVGHAIPTNLEATKQVDGALHEVVQFVRNHL